MSLAAQIGALATRAGDEIKAVRALVSNLLTSPAISNPTLTGSVVENIFPLTGTTPVLDPKNGTIQTWTLTGDSTPTYNFVDGESLLLMVDDGAACTISWSVTWTNNGKISPTLASTGFTEINLKSVGGVIYGLLVADGS